MKAARKILIYFLILSLSIFPIGKANASTWIIIDDVEDVVMWIDGTYTTQGNYANEIDFIDISLSDEFVIMQFKDTPIFNSKISYSMKIVWQSINTSQNYTEYHLGGSQLKHYVLTYFQDSNGSVIAGYAKFDSSIISDNQINFSIPGFEYLETIIPEEVDAFADKRTTLSPFVGDYFFDELKGEISEINPSNILGITFTSFITIIVLVYKRNKITNK